MFVYGAYLEGGICYVGQTVMSLAARKGSHLCNARKGRGSVFGKAIRKVGESSFKFVVLQEYRNQAELNLGEMEWIARLTPRYNMQAGGKLSFAPWNKGRKEERPEVLDRISESAKARKRTKRGKYSEAHKRKIGNATLARTKKPFVCENTGEIFENVVTAAKSYGLNQQSLSVLLGRYTRLRTLNGYTFTYL